MIWINDKAISVDVSFFLFVASIAAIIFIIGLAIGIETGRKLDHRLIKQRYFKLPSILPKQMVK